MAEKTKITSVLITGTSSGIGYETALLLDKKGYKVYAGVRNLKDGKLLQQKASTQLQPILIDITKPKEVTNAYSKIEAAMESKEEFAGVINNAGILIAGASEVVPIEDWQEIFDINVLGQIRVMQTFLPLLRKSQGRIINITSIGGEVAVPLVGPYSATKAAMNSITDTFRMELKKWKIHVSAIEPQPVYTPGWEKHEKKLQELYRKKGKSIKILYKKEFELIEGFTKKREFFTISPQQVAETIYQALTDDPPKRHYTVGPQAKILSVVKNILPIH